jgi:hypothetical protein
MTIIPTRQIIKAQMQMFYTDIKTLVARFPHATQMILLHTVHLADYTLMLPDDDESFRWLVKDRYQLFCGKPYTIGVHLKTCLKQFEKGRLVSDNPESDGQLIRSLVEQIEQLNILLRALVDALFDLYRMQRFNTMTTVLNLDNLNSLKHIVQFSIYRPNDNNPSPRNRLLSVELVAPDLLPRALYQPYHVPYLLQIIARALAWPELNTTMTLLFRLEATHSALRLTIPQFLMSTQRWETFQERVRQSDLDSQEWLRELGGNIEPLTWDEGYGQGVIVRLPWAKDL